MLSEQQRRRLEREKNSLEELYELQSDKISKIQKALTIETDPSRKFQYEQQLKEEESSLQELGDRLEGIEQQLQPTTPVSTISEVTRGKQKILILVAIPQPYLRLDKEIREIRAAIERATKRDLFEIDVRTAVRPQDIRRAIAEVRPQIVHFCGHGMEDGSLVLEDDGGNHKPVSPETLAVLFKLHTEYVSCVLLNACYSEKAATAISQYISYTIGMNQPIQDQAAIVFAQGFYDGLGYDNLGNQDIFQRAFDEGMAALQMENFAQGEVPVMRKMGV
ncbi:MAG: CHAT domain-containing protein [Scytonema sp. PMC 1069.18]|nr:CHAT domain-containing protein [Scytonema sp. PMC 1069.18]MEC4881737.1 CHAT domain-containing protein [Scytonema sp. PMC 1070.18]